MSTPPPYDFSGQDPFGQQPGYGQPGYSQPGHGQPAGGSGYGDPNLGGGSGTPSTSGSTPVPYDPFGGDYGSSGYPNYGYPGGAGQGPVAPASSPPSYLWLSVLLTVLSLFSCSWFEIGLFVGIVAIVFSARVNGLAARGDLAGASSASRIAGILNMVTGAMLVTTFLGEAILIAGGIWSVHSVTG